jgi:sugar (pentulose or hexulose) kinase
MGFITIDLGTTITKAAIFNDDLSLCAIESDQVVYDLKNGWVELDPDDYFKHITQLILRLKPKMTEKIRQIILTGQAETLVVLDASGNPLRKAVSWQDSRSIHECEELRNIFPEEKSYEITGQPANMTTWPVTKILWLKRNEPEIFKAAAKFVLLKDYIEYRFSGKLAGEYSIYSFSYYFDIQKKDYWDDILEYCGVRRHQLPELVDPCTIIGKILPAVALRLGLDPDINVNIGTLDHFAGMIGSGNIREGMISESTGTVVTLATMVDKPFLTRERIPCHHGPFHSSYVLLPVCESGGTCLEWFRRNFAADLSFAELDRLASQRPLPGELSFLPYLAGINSPDYSTAAKGVFYGIRLNHDRVDFALAVMEGVAFLLYQNLECFQKIGIYANHIIATGGGAKSDIWCRIKAGLTGYPFYVPVQSEAASLGCALIGAVTSGLYENYQQAVQSSVLMNKQYLPSHSDQYRTKRRLYEALYQSLSPVFIIDTNLSNRTDNRML